MALGGGGFTTQNKVLPGAYMNFVSAKNTGVNLGSRGVVGIGLNINWGVDDEIFTVKSDAFFETSLQIFGYASDHERLRGVRELFKNAQTIHAYKLTSGSEKASNTYATARYSGSRGNDLKIVIAANVDEPSTFDVSTYLDTTLVDIQRAVRTAAELKENDFVTFKKEAVLAVTASTPLSGGTDGAINVAKHQAFLNKIESYPDVNAIGYVGTDDVIRSLYIAFAKRMREEVGVKFQVVLHNKSADYEGVVNVKNTCEKEAAGLVYWVSGAIAGCRVNASNTNKRYDGEYKVHTDFTQAQLFSAIKQGEFALHRVGEDIRVLEDINSLTSVTEQKGEVFQSNQTIRVADQIATDIAGIFASKYLGSVPNDAAGRASLFTDIIKHHEQLQNVRAIENFDAKDVKVSIGADKKSVVVQDAIMVTNAMSKLYMNISVQ